MENVQTTIIYELRVYDEVILYLLHRFVLTIHMIIEIILKTSLLSNKILIWFN